MAVSPLYSKPYSFRRSATIPWITGT